MIKKKRLEKGWTQLDLAGKSGVPQPTISQIERGRRKSPTLRSIKNIAEALEVRIEELDEEAQTEY